MLWEKVCELGCRDDNGGGLLYFGDFVNGYIFMLFFG